MAVTRTEIVLTIKETVAGLLTARRALAKGRFTDLDDPWGARGETGPLASMQGLRTVFGACIALANEAGDIWSVVEPHRTSLLDEWKVTLHEFEQDGYHADPYDPGAIMKGILTSSGDRASYIDSVSWALSTSVIVNHATALWRQRGGQARDQELIELTRRQVLASLQLLLGAQCPDGGWSWCRGMRRGNLFFTWSVMEGLADLFDYILGESEKEIGVSADEEFIETLNKREPGVIDRVTASREKACAFLADRYLAKAVDAGLEQDDVSDDESIVVEAKNPLVMVYYELYLLEALILGAYDLRAGVPVRGRRDQLEALYRNIARKFPRIRDEGFARDVEASTLRFDIKVVRGRNKMTYAVQDAGLWPQLLRTLVLYRFYTKPDRVEDPDIIGERDSAFRLLLDDRREPGAEWEGLWDSEGFNLGVTARAVEGLIDCYDYLNLLERLNQRPAARAEPQVPVGGAAGDAIAVLASAIYPHIEARLKASGEERSADEMGGEDAADLIKRLRTGIADLVPRDDLAALLNRQFGDALTPLRPWDGVLSARELTARLVGPKADELEAQNPEAFQLLTMLVWSNFHVAVRLIDVIWQEAVLTQETDQERQRRYRGKESSGAKPLWERLRYVLMAVMRHEMEAMEANEPRPSYDRLLEQLLGRGGAPRSKRS